MLPIIGVVIGAIAGFALVPDVPAGVSVFSIDPTKTAAAVGSIGVGLLLVFQFPRNEAIRTAGLALITGGFAFFLGGALK
jgi:hypothetical protein